MYFTEPEFSALFSILIHAHIVLKISFGIIPRYMPRFFKWSPLFSIPFSHMRATFPERIILSDLSCSRDVWLKHLELSNHAVKNRQRRQPS